MASGSNGGGRAGRMAAYREGLKKGTPTSKRTNPKTNKN
jgi:hypothetical protein